MKKLKQKKIAIGMLCIITSSIILSVGALVFGIVQDFKKPTIILDQIDSNKDYGIIKGIINSNELNSLIIYQDNKYIFSKNHVDALSLYIFDKAISYSTLPFKKIKQYDMYEIKYEINNFNDEIIYKLNLYNQKINKEYVFKFLIKLVK